MGYFRPYCVASNGERFYLISLQPLDSGSVVPNDDPARSAFTRRIVLLRSTSYPTSFGTNTWTIVGSYPPKSTAITTNNYDVLVGDFALEMSNCQVDARGNFIWISAKSAAKDSTNPSQTTIVTTKPIGVQYSPGAEGESSQGTWSLISTSSLDPLGNYIWSNESKANALFSMAQGVFVHAIGLSNAAGIALGLLSGDNLVQSNVHWTLEASFGVPKAITFSNHTLYVLGSDKTLNAFPVNTTANNVTTLLAQQQAINSTTVKKNSLTTLSDECMNSSSYRLYSTAVEDRLYFLCTGVIPSAEFRVFSLRGTTLYGPFWITPPNVQSNISAFSAVSSSPNSIPGTDFLILAMNDNIYGMTIGPNGLIFDTANYIVGDSASFSNITQPPQPTKPDSNTDAGGAKKSSDDVTGGIVGSVALVLMIAAFFFWRRRCRKRPAKINELTRRFNGINYQTPASAHTSSDIVAPPLLSSQQPLMFDSMPTEEQHDQAQIKMQRMRLGPTPAVVVDASEGVALPLAPPTTSLVGSIPPITTLVSPAPFLLDQSHLKETYVHHLAHQNQDVILGEDSYSQPLYSEPLSESSITGLIPPSSKTYMHDSEDYSSGSGMRTSKGPFYYNNVSSPSLSSTSQAHPQLQLEQPHLSQREERKEQSESEDEEAMLHAPPPPYLAQMTLQLNTPSAPSSFDATH
ncbi:hypothetical protein BX616_004969 [Lobosporangium transversale]|uniref:Uncharacterized protein n=1 Tax=Lobosporangium transversale TaxID=64571 RepID=A0A1Y2GPX9_9FUNG|nr:hypothetical protein BCR41DRAFT_352161 [Lobosporangium transversale]KAF9897797.1 hypothetical protein BX616_004969 [Lobosporangium transversale]ORZ18298.1 hypothetical protein BCR41DRAFT_352161 [Lobosporangium transversale]|eukprot:XP_021882093.1 hypothetical protein BCR41DRAFT_352161 [Lobosporangium transversale]